CFRGNNRSGGCARSTTRSDEAGARPRLAHRHAGRREGAGSHLRAVPRGRAVHAGPHPRLGVAGDRAAAPAYLVRAVPAAGQAALSPLPAALPDGDRTVLLRSIRSGGQPQPLLREVDRPPRARAAPLLLPDADALRLGPVRRLLRARPDRPIL